MNIDPTIAITIVSNLVFLGLTAGYYRRTIKDLESRDTELSASLANLNQTLQGVQIELAEWRGKMTVIDMLQQQKTRT